MTERRDSPYEIMQAAIDVSQRSGFGTPSETPETALLTHGGSDRHFVRLTGGAPPLIALVQPGGGDEFERYVTIGRFLHRHGIGVPEQYAVDSERGVLLMEDLGDIHLENTLEGGTPEQEREIYERCLDVLVSLQTTVTAAMIAEGILEKRIFDIDILLGETAYFEREFVGNYAGLSCPREWEKERRLLAERLAGEPAVFMHRDFQSRNIMIAHGAIRIIDFQTAYRGPGTYDAASLLKDPYHPLPAATRDALLVKYHGDLCEAGGAVPVSCDRFLESFILAGIQRNCQALAAYAYLGLTKGKRKFLDSIQPGLTLLEEGITESGGFRVLREIVGKIREKKVEGMY